MSLNADHDPKLLDRKAVLEVYAAIINASITDEMRRALASEIFDHVDAQGRLLAQAGNVIWQYAICPTCKHPDWPRDPTTGWQCGDPFHPRREAAVSEIKRAMQ